MATPESDRNCAYRWTGRRNSHLFTRRLFRVINILLSVTTGIFYNAMRHNLL